MMNEDPLMDEEQAGDAVAKYLEDNPELLQGIVPEHDLWPAIESRISARVIPLGAPASRKPRISMGWIPMLLAASLLIAGSAGLTYVATTRANNASARRASNSVANNGSVTANPTQASRAANAGTTQGVPQIAQQGETTITHADDAVRGNLPAAQPARSAVRIGQLASRNSGASTDGVRKTYDSEITALHATLDRRRGQLNPTTVAIIEQNLSVIDEAIRQSEEALARDPNSRLLNDQLDRTLAKKTGLLRAAVLLPAA